MAYNGVKTKAGRGNELLLDALYPFRSQNIVNLHTSRNVNKTPTIANLGDAYVRSAVWLRVCLSLSEPAHLVPRDYDLLLL